MSSTQPFGELISGYLQNLMRDVEQRYGKESAEYKALFYQYVKTECEQQEMQEHNQKHYEAVVNAAEDGVRYMERLYKRQVTIDLTTACSAHCRYCLRQNYSNILVTPQDEDAIIEYLKTNLSLKEVLITGGDPLLIGERLIRLMKRIIGEASNIRIIRIGTRLPVQNPNKLDDRLLSFFAEHKNKVFFEVALQINHVIELQSETENCIRALQECGVTVYAQNVLLRNINDSIDSLVNLYDALRYQHVEAHYLFHPVPICRTAQFRMPVMEFLDFARKLTASGEIPGRCKPMFSLMTDAGKCTLYHGMLLDKDANGFYDINTGYRLEERLRWNPNYRLPESARISEDGTIIVKYLDGKE